MFWFMRFLHDPILAELASLQQSINDWKITIMSALDNLKREVEETKTINQSVIALLQGLKAKLDEAIATNDPAALQALADSLDVEQQTLATAVTANTPVVEPTPVPAPQPEPNTPPV